MAESYISVLLIKICAVEKDNTYTKKRNDSGQN